MITTWKDRIATVGWDVPLRDFCWGTTLEDSFEATIEVTGQMIRRVPRGEGFKALRTTITFDGRCNAEFRMRCGRAWAAYWANVRIFQRFEANLYRRMGRLERLVVPSLLWCGEPLQHPVHIVEQILIFEFHFLSWDLFQRVCTSTDKSRFFCKVSWR